jgi:hypothetical protein
MDAAKILRNLRIQNLISSFNNPSHTGTNTTGNTKKIFRTCKWLCLTQLAPSPGQSLRKTEKDTGKLATQ